MLNLKEYKKKAVEEVELPSGMRIKVRRSISQYTFMKICAEHDITFEEGKADPKQMVTLAEELIRTYVIEPKMPDEWDVDDLLNEDFLFLYERVMALIGGRREDREAIKKIGEQQGDF